MINILYFLILRAIRLVLLPTHTVVLVALLLRLGKLLLQLHVVEADIDMRDALRIGFDVLLAHVLLSDFVGHGQASPFQHRDIFDDLR